MNVLEICVDSVDSAMAAEAGGADRVELCSALSEGGLTPSLGLLRAVRAKLTIGVHVMVRPRGGNFLYSASEFDVMRKDIEVAAEAGASGVVFGMLNTAGEIDLERTRLLVELARPMEVTFHRAIDLVADPLAALEAIVQSGADRVLTSGGEANALLGHAQIRQLVRAARGRIRIMACGGVRAENLEQLLDQTGAREWHTAARRHAGTQEAAPQAASGVAEQLGCGREPGPIFAHDVRQLRDILSRPTVAAGSL
jgi:copper homeostasis protein